MHGDTKRKLYGILVRKTLEVPEFLVGSLSFHFLTTERFSENDGFWFGKLDKAVTVVEH